MSTTTRPRRERLSFHVFWLGLAVGIVVVGVVLTSTSASTWGIGVVTGGLVGVVRNGWELAQFLRRRQPDHHPAP